MPTDTKPDLSDLSEDERKLLEKLEGKKIPTQIAVALFAMVCHQMEKRTMDDMQFYDAFMAGLNAYRIAASESFLGIFFKDDAAVTRLKIAGGISATSLAMMLAQATEQRAKAAKRFANMTIMMEGDHK